MRVEQGRDQGVEDVSEGAGHVVRFGKRPRVGFVLEGPVGAELKLGGDMIGRG